jgi:hypothetical protein
MDPDDMGAGGSVDTRQLSQHGRRSQIQRPHGIGPPYAQMAHEPLVRSVGFQ